MDKYTDEREFWSLRRERCEQQKFAIGLGSFSSPSWRQDAFLLFGDNDAISKMTFSRISLPGSYMELRGALCMTFPCQITKKSSDLDSFLPASYRPFLLLLLSLSYILYDIIQNDYNILKHHPQSRIFFYKMFWK